LYNLAWLHRPRRLRFARLTRCRQVSCCLDPDLSLNVLLRCSVVGPCRRH
jgi:hypothetical protein